jgi:hypothetical protein
VTSGISQEFLNCGWFLKVDGSTSSKARFGSSGTAPYTLASASLLLTDPPTQAAGAEPASARTQTM